MNWAGLVETEYEPVLRQICTTKPVLMRVDSLGYGESISACSFIVCSQFPFHPLIVSALYALDFFVRLEFRI